MVRALDLLPKLGVHKSRRCGSIDKFPRVQQVELSPYLKAPVLLALLAEYKNTYLKDVCVIQQAKARRVGTVC